LLLYAQLIKPESWFKNQWVLDLSEQTYFSSVFPKFYQANSGWFLLTRLWPTTI